MKKNLLIVMVFLILFGCGKGNEDQIKAPGIVEGEIISIKSKVAAEVKEVFIKEGEKIALGSKIILLDSRVINNKLKDLELNIDEININFKKLQAKMVFVKANRDYLRKKTASFERLNKKKSVSGEDLERVRLRSLEADTTYFEIISGLENLKVQKKRLETKRDYFNIILEDYSIMSRIDGVVLEKFIASGETVFPGMTLADVLDLKSMYVEVFIEEEELYSFQLGKRVRIEVDGFDKKELSGKIAMIGKKAEFSPKYVISEIERKALLYKVKIKIEDSFNVFKIGMPVTIILDK
ncbi:MAG: efflux RND transporter periplasmic adaptor subunit [Acidobacteriota bacterium]